MQEVIGSTPLSSTHKLAATAMLAAFLVFYKYCNKHSKTLRKYIFVPQMLRNYIATSLVCV